MSVQSEIRDEKGQMTQEVFDVEREIGSEIEAVLDAYKDILSYDALMLIMINQVFTLCTLRVIMEAKNDDHT